MAEEIKLVEVDIDNDCAINEVVIDNGIEFDFPKVDDTNVDHLAEAVNHIQYLIHNLRLAYDVKPDKRLSDIIVAQELSARELNNLINQ